MYTNLCRNVYESCTHLMRLTLFKYDLMRADFRPCLLVDSTKNEVNSVVFFGGGGGGGGGTINNYKPRPVETYFHFLVEWKSVKRKG